MVDLTPNFAPELYSQGVGTGSAQVFDLGAPNPFEVAKQNQEQTLANQQELNKKLIDYETKKQEKLDGFLEKYSDMTSEWGKTQTALGKEVNKYGDLISGMRALNKSVDSESVMAAQKSLKELAKQNEENYKKYSKIGTEMTDVNIYSDEERAAFEAEIDAANEKENPIQEIQKVVDTWQKSLATPDVVALYKKQKPEAKDKTGYLVATTEADAKQVVDNIWANMKPIEKKKTLDRYVKEGKIDPALAVKFTDSNGAYDLNNPDMETKVSQLMFEEVKPQMEYDVTPYPIRSGDGSKNESPFTINSQPLPGGNPELMQTIAISKTGGGSVPPSNFRDKYGTYNMTPDRIVYVDENNTGYEYVTDENGKIKKDNNGKPLKQKAAAGWYIMGKIQKEAGTKAIEPGESADAAIRSVADQKGWSVSDYTAKQENGQWKFYKLESKQVPYEDNKALMKNYGVESLEAVAAMNPQYKGIAGQSTGGGELD